MTAEVVDRDWLAFRERLERAVGVPLGAYKEPQLKRRLQAVMIRQRQRSWAAFAHAIEQDASLLATVRDTITINVSEFYRQADRFDELQARILPELLRQRRTLRLWSAGCSIGCEPYTLAILLEELDPRGLHSVLATDVDMPVLGRARAGAGYLPSEVRSVPPAMLGRYFVEERGTYRVAEPLKRRVNFRRHDLLRDAYPSDVDVILCRNVVIYFTDEAKQRIYRGFAQALRPGGYLFVGGSEMIMRAGDLGLRASGTSLYQLAA